MTYKIYLWSTSPVFGLNKQTSLRDAAQFSCPYTQKHSNQSIYLCETECLHSFQFRHLICSSWDSLNISTVTSLSTWKHLDWFTLIVTACSLWRGFSFSLGISASIKKSWHLACVISWKCYVKMFVCKVFAASLGVPQMLVITFTACWNREPSPFILS